MAITYKKYNYIDYEGQKVVSEYDIKEGDKLYFQNTDILTKDIDAYLKAKFANVKRVTKVENANVVYGYHLTTKYGYEYEGVIYEKAFDIEAVRKHGAHHNARRAALRTPYVEEVSIISTKVDNIYNVVSSNPSKYTLVKNTDGLQTFVDQYSTSLLPKPPDGLGEKLQYMILHDSFLLAKAFLQGKNVADYETELIECFYMLGRYATEERKWIKELFKLNKKIYKLLDLRNATSEYWSLFNFCNIKKLHPSINLLKVISAHLTV